MLLYNNRWICLLPFARKPDPRRVSKQVSREPPQAWLFGLVRPLPSSVAGRRRRATSLLLPTHQLISGCWATQSTPVH